MEEGRAENVGIVRTSLIVCLSVLLLVSQAWSQEEPSPSPSPSLSPSPSAEALDPDNEDSETPTPKPKPVVPTTVKAKKSRAGLTQASEDLVVESFPLFRVVGTETLTARDRAALVSQRVQKVIDEYGADPPPVRVERIMGTTVVLAGEQVLITVTDDDIPEYELAEQPLQLRLQLENEVAWVWRDALQKELDLAATMRTEAYQRLAWSVVIALFALSVLGHRGLNWIGRKFLGSPFWSAKFLLWAGALYISLRLFPPSRTWAGLVYRGVLFPYLLLIALFITTLLASRGLEHLVHRYFLALQANQEGVHLSRLGLRLATLDQAACVSVRVLAFGVGVIVYLIYLEIDLGSALAGAGLVGITVGLATQDLIKNVLAGIHILLEDHFGIGDVIEWNGLSGTVEAFHLRCTQIRTIDGRLITIPNSSLQVVQNHSNQWGRVDYRVEVAYKENLGRALEVLEEVADELFEEWEDQITEPPAILGVETLGDNGITLRLLLRTIPLSQWSVKRELNRRVKDRFDKEGIEIPFPQRTVWNANNLSQPEACQEPPKHEGKEG